MNGRYCIQKGNLMKFAYLTLAIGTAGFAEQVSAVPPAAGPETQQTASAEAKKLCKFVVAADPGSKPYQLCLSPAGWVARDKLASQDATHNECHYVQQSGDRFRSTKVCMSATEWENQRQADRAEVDKLQRSTCVPGGGC
jgi:hypothetical protein